MRTAGFSIFEAELFQFVTVTFIKSLVCIVVINKPAQSYSIQVLPIVGTAMALCALNYSYVSLMTVKILSDTFSVT